MSKIIILLAVQGAGKGTVAKLINQKYGYAHISTGDILRERALVDDDKGREIKNLIDNGIFVSNDIILEAIEYRIKQDDCKDGFILDGFPRTLTQAELYEDLLIKNNLKVGGVINLILADELLTKRIIGRRMCKECGAIYNIYSEEFAPKNENVCDKCGGALYQRDDDNEKSMRVRINTYYEQTKPIIDFYKEKSRVFEIDASKKIESIFDEVCDIIDNLDAE